MVWFCMAFRRRKQPVVGFNESIGSDGRSIAAAILREAIVKSRAIVTALIVACILLTCILGGAEAKKTMKKEPFGKTEDGEPVDLDGQLTDEERLVRDTAEGYAQEKLLPRQVERRIEIARPADAVFDVVAEDPEHPHVSDDVEPPGVEKQRGHEGPVGVREPGLRREIEERAAKQGWPRLHAELARVLRPLPCSPLFSPGTTTSSR